MPACPHHDFERTYPGAQSPLSHYIASACGLQPDLRQYIVRREKERVSIAAAERAIGDCLLRGDDAK